MVQNYPAVEESPEDFEADMEDDDLDMVDFLDD